MVWSDPLVAKLSREFVTVADEVYTLYPEDKWNLDRVKDTEEHKFFKRYGESMPEGDWNDPGTKQGLYMIGPNAEYLEGRFAASAFPDDIAERMQRALDRWKVLAKKKGYKNRSVPKVVSTAPPRVDGKEFVLRVHSRDLPRGDRGSDDARFDKKRHEEAGWMGFTKWAWNENWLAVDDWRALVPKGRKEQSVDGDLVRLLAQQMLIDSVRGQAGTWRKRAVKKATLSMSRKGKRVTYRGEVDLDDGERSIRARLYGEGEYDSKKRDLVRFELVALGTRRGAHTFNQRGEDPGPAPIGFALTRYR